MSGFSDLLKAMPLAVWWLLGLIAGHLAANLFI